MGDDRRLRRDALGRPALDGPRADRRNLVAARCATPLGELATLEAPASAAGPALRELIAGSEGALGVITRVALRVHPRPVAERYEGWIVPGFEGGCEALRRLVQEGAAPDVARLSDAGETRFSLASRAPGRSRAGRSAAGACSSAGGRARPMRSPAGAARRPGRCVAPVRASPPSARAGMGRDAVRRPLLPRPAHGPRGDGRDAGDRDVMVEPLSAARRRARAALGGAMVGLPRLAPVSRPAPRCTSPSSPAATTSTRRPVAGAQAAATEAIVAAGGAHAPPRGRPRPRAVAGGRGRFARHRDSARGQGALRPRGDHEPRQAAARMTSASASIAPANACDGGVA